MEQEKEMVGFDKENRVAYKLGEVSRMLGVSSVTIRRLIKRGDLKRVHGIRHILVPASEIERFLKVV